MAVVRWKSRKERNSEAMKNSLEKAMAFEGKAKADKKVMKLWKWKKMSEGQSRRVSWDAK